MPTAQAPHREQPNTKRFAQGVRRAPDTEAKRSGPSKEPIMTRSTQAAAAFEIRFQSLFHQGRALAFPCDHQGRVDLDHVSDRARNNYLFARAMVGREFAMPMVREVPWH
jgi:hypothetical protein